MQSFLCSAAPGALHTWVPLEWGGDKLMNSDKTKLSSPHLSYRKPARKSASTQVTAMRQPCAVLAVDTDRRDEERMAGGHGSNGSMSKHGDKKQNLELENVSRMNGFSTLDYIELVKEFFEEDGGLPRWFSPDEKTQEAPTPLLLYLPGILGVGSGIPFHYESLGRLFELRCLHIPNMDRTPFEELTAMIDEVIEIAYTTGLVSLVEDMVREEAKQFPGRPIYLVGDNLGGALALAVAAQNPRLDLVLILMNPSTSFDKSQLQPFLPVIQALPEAMFSAAPFLLGSLLRDPNQLTSSKLSSLLPSFETAEQFSDSLRSFVSTTQKLVTSLSKEAVLWKLQMLNSSAKYTNSRLQDVKAAVLVLASNQDRFLPSLEEARRLSRTLSQCTYRQFEESSHSLLLDKDFDLASTIKKTAMYRKTALKDVVANFVPPTDEEINSFYDDQKLFRRLISPVFFSTGDDGKVVEGLSMIPSKGPLIFVGNHSLLGLDMKTVASTLIKNRGVILRALAHPILFHKDFLEEQPKMVEGDLGRLFGAVPVSGKNFYKLLARGDNVALYPGGAREALHRKGETHKLIWPDLPEFVKMASRFDATIIPMCTVGEDDVVEVKVDYEEMITWPVLGNMIVDFHKDLPRLRADMDGEISKQALHMPIFAPSKSTGPGRMYILFGKPMHLRGKREFFRDPKNVMATYQELKREVEASIDYLLRKRQEDPYREFLPRFLHEASLGEDVQAPTFKP